MTAAVPLVATVRVAMTTVAARRHRVITTNLAIVDTTARRPVLAVQLMSMDLLVPDILMMVMMRVDHLLVADMRLMRT